METWSSWYTDVGMDRRLRDGRALCSQDYRCGRVLRDRALFTPLSATRTGRVGELVVHEPCYAPFGYVGSSATAIPKKSIAIAIVVWKFTPLIASPSWWKMIVVRHRLSHVDDVFNVRRHPACPVNLGRQRSEYVLDPVLLICLDYLAASISFLMFSAMLCPPADGGRVCVYRMRRYCVEPQRRRRDICVLQHFLAS